MASTFAVTRKHLIFGLCLPLAVLLGYLLAEPYASSSLSILVMFFAVLVVPVLMRWYQPMLVFCWNFTAAPMFLPGNMPLWIFMVFAGLFFTTLNRSVDRNYQLTNVPSLTWPLVTLLAVVIATAMATGGVGLRIMGSSGVGGKGYIYLVAAIVGYFVISTRPIPTKHAGFMIALFFLPGASAIVSVIANKIGPGANFLMYFFGNVSESNDFVADRSFEPGVLRMMGLMPAATSVFCWLIARYSVTGLFDLSRPWRTVAFIGVVVLGCLGGYRAMLILMIMIVMVLVVLERMWHTRAFLILVIGSVLTATALILAANKLPLSMQRTLSFLPVEIDPLAKQAAEISTEWRIEMWKEVSTQIPNYLMLGKGYILSSTDLYIVEESRARGFTTSWEGAVIAGDYHSGPLTLIIPFGIWGVLAFGWLLYAGTRYLYKVYQDCPMELKIINRFLLALFLVRIVFFLLVFGAFYQELFEFTGILGLSVALNTEGQKASSENSNTFDDGPK